MKVAELAEKLQAKYADVSGFNQLSWASEYLHQAKERLDESQEIRGKSNRIQRALNHLFQATILLQEEMDAEVEKR